MKPFKESKDSKKVQVERMFDEVASLYDRLNRILSFGIDKGWRKRMIAAISSKEPQLMLDVATGTGDVAIALSKAYPEASIIGVDLSAKMLDVARDKVQNYPQIILDQGDSENLKYQDGQFDVVTVSFGVRNFGDLNKGLSEIRRVLKPGGQLLILEFSNPQKFPVKQYYRFYSRYILPKVGKNISDSQKAYDSLPKSVEAFPFGREMVVILEQNGFNKVSCKELSFGIASLYSGFVA